MIENGRMKYTIEKCPRCNETHINLECQELTNPKSGFTYTKDGNLLVLDKFAICPNTNQPIIGSSKPNIFLYLCS